MKKSYKGFTLVELIVVIAIIGILAAILVPSLLGFVRDAKVSRAQADAKAIYTSLMGYMKLENGGDMPNTKIYLDTALAAGGGRAKLVYGGAMDPLHLGASGPAEAAKAELLGILSSPDYANGFVVFVSRNTTEYYIDGIYMFCEVPPNALIADHTTLPDAQYPLNCHDALSVGAGY